MGMRKIGIFVDKKVGSTVIFTSHKKRMWVTPFPFPPPLPLQTQKEKKPTLLPSLPPTTTIPPLFPSRGSDQFAVGMEPGQIMIGEMLHLAAEDGDGEEIGVALACDLVVADLGGVSWGDGGGGGKRRGKEGKEGGAYGFDAPLKAVLEAFAHGVFVERA